MIDFKELPAKDKIYYQDESVVIYCADCREILPLFPKKSFDLVLTDPPYGINHSTGWKEGEADWLGTEIANDDDTSARDFVLDLLKDVPAVVFGSHKRNIPSKTRMVLIWDKGEALGMGDLSLPWKPSWEQIYIIGKGFYGERTSAVLYNPPVQSMAKNERIHPNQKPINLIIRLLHKCPIGTILDPFLGSGTTAVAAKILGRKCIGIEISEKYCEIAAKRCQQSVMKLDIPKEESQQENML